MTTTQIHHTVSPSLSEIKQQLKQAQNEKREISSQFKFHKSDPTALNALKEKMQAVSRHIKSLEEQRKQLEQAEHEPENKAPLSPQLPPQFTTSLNTSPEQDIQIKLVDDTSSSQWDEYANSMQQANAYHSYCWRKIITQSFSHPSYYFAAYTGDRIVGILPVFWLNSKLFGSFGVSVPFFNYGGPLANSQTIAQKLMDAAAEVASTNQFSHLEIRTTQPEFSWPSESKKVSMILRLPKTKEQLDDSLGAKVRAQAKQANQYSPTIQFGKLELLEDFYRVFSRNMRDLGTPVYGRALFENILKNDSVDATLVVTYLRDQPVGAAFLTAHRTMMEIPWASTIKSANPMNINMWMYHHILHHCIDRGFHYFDFGRSTKNAGTYRFKKQWGSTPVEHFWYTWRPEDEDAPELNPDNPKFKLMIAVWKRLPLMVANLIGPHIVKNLP